MQIAMLAIGACVGAGLASLLAAGRLRTERALRGAAETAHADQRRLLEASRAQLRDEMKSISADVLRETGETLGREIAAQRNADAARAAGEMEKRTLELRSLMEPMREKLGKVESELEKIERERRESQGQLGEMFRQVGDGLQALRLETGSLVGALKRPTTRGSWGEIQLRNVIEMAGMVSHCDFTEQTTIETDDGRLRPDVLVRLPGGKLIVVDSKVPLDAYLAATEATDDAERALHMARHARQTRDHITKLASKAYQSQLDSTPELVVMFIPSDGIYHAALSEDPALLEYGVEQQVLIATPTTLIALLRAVHYGWKQELIAKSAREIAETGRELHRRIARFAEPFARVGRQLGSAVNAYNEAVGSFESRVVPQLRRIEEAGAASEREVALAPVEEAPRALSAALDPVDDDEPQATLAALPGSQTRPPAVDRARRRAG
jgi:DNA recombination protein RmuC